MTPKELPSDTADRMMTQGLVVLFGPDYLDNSLRMIQDLGGELPPIVILTCEKIDDLLIPDGPALNGSLMFFHTKPAHMDPGAWDTALLKDLDLRSMPPRGLGVPDRSPEQPSVELAAESGDEMQLIVTWLRPLESGHLLRVARAIERSFVEHGGRYRDA